MMRLMFTLSDLCLFHTFVFSTMKKAMLIINFLMTDHSGNSEFCFKTSNLNVSFNTTEILWEKFPVSLGTGHYSL